ncbi:hypothetical protein [Algibacter sp. PT7-4]|uniref:hypothetical protein n=1 Tax=Algibacter ulvanivorans TaxID=3400999 RepID=UPI003AAA9DD5
MYTNTCKQLKSLFLNVVVITMSVCYVFGPNYKVVNKLLHSLSHQINIQENLNSTTFSKVHHHHHHSKNVSEINHNHEFLEILNEVLEASSTKNNPETPEILEFKIDKHIKTREDYLTRHLFWFSTYKKVFFAPYQKVSKGFLKEIIKPPQFG